MTANLNEAIITLRKAGSNKVRSVPMPGEDVNTGMYLVEAMVDGSWRSVVANIPRATAESLIAEATNRLLLG